MMVMVMRDDDDDEVFEIVVWVCCEVMMWMCDDVMDGWVDEDEEMVEEREMEMEMWLGTLCATASTSGRVFERVFEVM